MRSIAAIIVALLFATILVTAEALPSQGLIRDKRQAGTMNCLLYGICGKPKDYRNFKTNRRYGPYYHNKFYQRRGHGT
uniref:Secreted protein n=1 Tax=Syphacia muris TaxID=451379 RepID=A0A0N5AKQ7_9BILA